MFDPCITHQILLKTPPPGGVFICDWESLDLVFKRTQARATRVESRTTEHR
jgi:hypothetical protein